MSDISVLVGKTLTEVRRDGDEEIFFVTTDGDTFKMYHSQDCCESVEIDDIEGDLDSLVGNPILVAVEVSQEDPNASESGTWTFYKLATIKGYVDIRWYGSSNGYYSESVNFDQVSA
ncbi:hypothetical protein HLI01_08975 [Rhizobium laguerreae]|uniref:DUF7448 domain-containing protein n=1 Tax=Rhizobium laguerreae TaxID=1076926 RepID=UPI0014785E5E|nr:hypothetical protein [Rhizobium laguerreae]NNH56939.1 hypothetical protein [Rhizobium laguerreae]